MHVRALCGILRVAWRFLHDFHIETYGQSLGREALGIIAGLVAQDAVHHIFSRHHRVQRVDGYRW
jgi:hypothetical protein